MERVLKIKQCWRCGKVFDLETGTWVELPEEDSLENLSQSLLLKLMGIEIKRTEISDNDPCPTCHAQTGGLKKKDIVEQSKKD